MDQNEMRFELTLEARADRKQIRSLAAAAAVYLRDAVCEEADILWPGDITLGGERVARVERAPRDGAIRLFFTVAAPYAAADLPEKLLAALRSKAAGFPENNAELIQEYTNSCRTVMKYVDTVYRGMPVYGFAFAVDKYGGLMVMTQETRTVITVYTGRADIAVDEPQQPDYPLMPRV